MEPMTEEWHNKFGVFKNGFGAFEYLLPETRTSELKICFNDEYVWLRQPSDDKSYNDDVICIWNMDKTKRQMSVNEWKNLYFLLTGETLTITQTI